MPNISALFVKKNIEQAKNIQDQDLLYELVGLTAEQTKDPLTKVPADKYFQLLETIAESEAGHLSFHLRTAAAMRCEEYGAVGLALKSAPTLRHALRRMDRHTRLFNDASQFSLVEGPETTTWAHARPEPARLGNYLSNEAALATFLTLLRQASARQFSPILVEFQHTQLPSRPELEEYFGCGLRYNCEADRLILATRDLDAPNPVGDEHIWRYFLDRLEAELSSLPPGDVSALEHHAAEVVARMLSGGVPTLADVAEGLGMGTRTLQRRLAARGQTFQTLVDNARKHLALRLVSSTGYPLTEIAFLTGFSEQSSFSRAFKRWSGKTPRTYRATILG